ncbi:MAG: hypothetical protein WBL67_15565, partial [Nitrososphaeraceae archaeon]
ISKYINETLPLEYETCLIGLNAISCKTWDIANSPHSNERDRLQAVSIGMQAYSMKIDLLTNATVVERAVHFVDKHRDETFIPQRTELVIDNDSAELRQDTG